MKAAGARRHRRANGVHFFGCVVPQWRRLAAEHNRRCSPQQLVYDSPTVNMASSARKIAPNMWRVYATKPEVFPVIGCIAVALGWCTYMSSRHLFTSPDVSLSRARRGSPLKDVEEEAVAWRQMNRGLIAKDVSKIRIFDGYDKKY